MGANKMSITLRQKLNNHDMTRIINSSSPGQRFQESPFAREIEAVIHLTGKGIENSISSGHGYIDGFVRGIADACNKMTRTYYAMHRIEASRPDLNGGIDPRMYDKSIALQNYGHTKEEAINYIDWAY
jgi:hypothetical protein